MGWLESLPSHKLSEGAKDKLDRGVVYQLGRDVDLRPILVINLSKSKDLVADTDSTCEAMQHILVLVREKMLMPHHLEKWIMILDTNDCSDLGNLNEFLTVISQTISDNFPQTLEKVLIINDGSLQGEPIVFKRKKLLQLFIYFHSIFLKF